MNVFELVKRDLDGRNELGKRSYGGEMNAHDSSRDWLIEAYQEALDLAVYLRAELAKRETVRP
ncbi:MAG TPA: hypothetical protein VJQ59_02060 [Candidatus Sulfotelmatobacter sp.]|nr:hypothetical protein [Candidatus Sulfotelmatobacter sp.]